MHQRAGGPEAVKVRFSSEAKLDLCAPSSRHFLVERLGQGLHHTWLGLGKTIALQQRHEPLLTYAELQERVAKEQRSLSRLGLAQPGTATTVVGVHCPDDTGNYVSSLALLASGAAQALLPVQISTTMLHDLVHQFDCDVVVSRDPDLGARLELDRIGQSAEGAHLYQRRASSPAPRISGPERRIDDNLCSILCRSSGTTTGQPTVSKISLIRVLNQLIQRGDPPFGIIRRPLSGCDLQNLSPKLFKLGTLIRGQTLCLRRPEETLLNCIERTQATGFSLWPTVARDLLSKGALTTLPPGFLCVLSGDHVPMTLRREIAALRHVRLAISYATSQTGPLTYLPPEEVLDQEESIGHPLSNVRIEPVGAGKLLGGNHRFHDVLVSKDFAVSIDAIPGLPPSRLDDPQIDLSDGLAARQTITSWICECVEDFCPNDLIAFSTSGHLIFGGRSNDTFLFQSYLIAPLEIETVISLHPAVAECVAFGAPFPNYGAVPMAAVVLKPGYEARGAAIRIELAELCRDHLGFRSPKKLIITETIPRNASGKPLRRQLAAEQASTP